MSMNQLAASASSACACSRVSGGPSRTLRRHQPATSARSGGSIFAARRAARGSFTATTGYRPYAESGLRAGAESAAAPSIFSTTMSPELPGMRSPA